MREIEDAVVALVPVLQALADLRLGRAGLEAHERVGEVVADVVVLRREVVALGLAFLADQLRLLGALVHVVRDRAHVVEELRVDRPLLVLVPDRLADERCAALGHRVLQGEAASPADDVAQAFVGRAVVVGGRRGGGEPALVDAAAIEAEGVEVVGMQLEPLARLQERARHPAGGEAQQAAVVLERAFHQGADVGRDGFKRSHEIHEYARETTVREAGRLLFQCACGASMLLPTRWP